MPECWGLGLLHVSQISKVTVRNERTEVKHQPSLARRGWWLRNHARRWPCWHPHWWKTTVSCRPPLPRRRRPRSFVDIETLAIESARGLLSLCEGEGLLPGRLRRRRGQSHCVSDCDPTTGADNGVITKTIQDIGHARSIVSLGRGGRCEDEVARWYCEIGIPSQREVSWLLLPEAPAPGIWRSSREIRSPWVARSVKESRVCAPDRSDK